MKNNEKMKYYVEKVLYWIYLTAVSLKNKHDVYRSASE